MILKTLKTQLAAATFAAAALVSVPSTVYAQESSYCICVADCWGSGGPDPVGCMDWCAMIHMVTICEGVTPQLHMDRR
jgi:hypothetical protein